MQFHTALMRTFYPIGKRIETVIGSKPLTSRKPLTIREYFGRIHSITCGSHLKKHGIEAKLLTIVKYLIGILHQLLRINRCFFRIIYVCYSRYPYTLHFFFGMHCLYMYRQKCNNKQHCKNSFYHISSSPPFFIFSNHVLSLSS